MRIRPFLITFFWMLLHGRLRQHTSQLSHHRCWKACTFSRTRSKCKSGSPSRLHLVNKDGYAHAFDLDAFDIHLHLAANEKIEVTFTPTQSRHIYLLLRFTRPRGGRHGRIHYGQTVAKNLGTLINDLQMIQL